METKGGDKQSSHNRTHYEAPLGYTIEDVRPHGEIKKFCCAAYSNPSPHCSFAEEVFYLEKFFGKLGLGGKAYVLGDTGISHQWHVYSASANEATHDSNSSPTFLLEMCMTQLDCKRSSVFYKSNSESAAEMTLNSGICDILPYSEICDLEFDPCGYSMNAIEGSAVSTIHVTPEDGFSYSSFEAIGYNPKECDFEVLMEKVLSCFRPKAFSIAVHMNTCVRQSTWSMPFGPQGYVCERTSHQEFRGQSHVVYHTYRMNDCGFPKVALPFPIWEVDGEVNDHCQVKENESRYLTCIVQQT